MRIVLLPFKGGGIGLLLLGRYKKGETEGKMSTVGYLSHLDKWLGLPSGTLLELCQKSVKTSVVESRDYKITYRGKTRRSTRVGPKHFLPMSRMVFLIEGVQSSGGRKVLAQISLSEEASRPR
ncbi:MAG: hypothetical protein HY619_04295 [Thaumarchaeota archaeon]|nr:hypothetical protein [Nitrososphaerota archaeon]